MDKKIIVESLINSNEFLEIEKTENFAMRRIATWETPNVEYAYENAYSLDTIAFFFPHMNDEGKTIIKETLQIINSFDACIVCFMADDLMKANYFCDQIIETGLEALQIGTAVYDISNNTRMIKMYTKADRTVKKRSRSEQKAYWCWWRDASQYEVATLLELSDKYNLDQGDIYTQKVYPEFYEMMINKETKQWDGKPRNKNYSKASFKAEKQNYKIPMCQLGLWDAQTGHITDKGRFLLEVVRKNGDESKIYMSYLSKMILLDGKHLDLIKDLDEFQKNCPELIPESSAEFFILFDNYMETKNSLGTRKPTAVKTGAKKSYVRDEPKLWNKLGIIIPSGRGRYYWPFKGVRFNWDKINEILLASGTEEDNNE